MRRFVLLLLAAMSTAISCSEDEEVPNNLPVAEIRIEDGIDRILLDGGGSTDPDGGKLSYTWSASAPVVIEQNPTSPGAFFKIPAGTGQTVDVTLTVSDGKGSQAATMPVTVPALTEIRAFGLGKSLIKQTDNTVDYEWYYDQGNSGTYSLINCGPASVTMAVKWADPAFSKSVEYARQTYRPGGGWWYTSDIISYLNLFQVPNTTVELTSMQDAIDQLDDGNILILCLDMFHVTFSDKPYRYDKFYPTQSAGWGHFIVVKGYKKVDAQTYFEVFDPYSLSRKYEDQTYKGRNRYYRLADLDKATNEWWNYAIVVSAKDSQGGRKAFRNAVNNDEIVHMPGR